MAISCLMSLQTYKTETGAHRMQLKTIFNQVVNYKPFVVEQVPWADGKSPLTTEFKWFLAGWARRDLSGIESIGIDEVQWKQGHQYQTLAYQIDEGRKRLLWIGPDRTSKTLLRFFRFLGKERSAKLEFVCSDMWQAYLKVIAKKAPQAIHVLDRFHVMQKMGKTLRSKRELLLNWFRAGGALSSGVVEGFNNKLKLITRKSYGFRTQEAYETALYHNLGDLPEPVFTHRFY